MDKRLSLKDLEEFKNKDLLKLLNRCPFWVCEETYDEYEKKMTYTSILIVGLTPDSFIYSNVKSYCDDDCEWGSPIRSYNEIEFLPFDQIDKSYILANDATPKQKEWLEKHDYDPDEYCGYHAWHIIDEAIKEAAMERENYKRSREEEFCDCWDDDEIDFLF